MVKIAADVLESNYLVALFIPLFIFLTFCLIVLVAFEILAAWSIGTLTFYPEYPFHGVSGFFSNFLTILIFFEFYWGMFFLKQACTFYFLTNSSQLYCFGILRFVVLLL